MSLDNIHGLYAVSFQNDGDGSATVLDSVARVQLSQSNAFNREQTSGSVYDRFITILAQTHSASLETKRLATWLAEIGLTGLPIVDGALGEYGLRLYAQKFDESAGGRASGSNHRSYTIANGLLVPSRLSVSHQGDAMLTCNLFVKYDGTNDPVVVATSVSLPALDGDDERFTLGGVTLGSKTFDGKQSLEIDFGVTVREEGADSDIWPTALSIVSIQPTLTLTGVKPEWLTADTTTLPIEGLACTHANSTIYLRKRAQGGTGFVADGTAEHIKFTVDGLAAIETIFDASPGSPAETSLTLPLEWDGTNAPLTIDTASTIT
jgi:hypothetical protein